MKTTCSFLLLVCALMLAYTASRAQQSNFCDVNSCYYDYTCYDTIAAPVNYTFATAHNVYGNGAVNIPLTMDVYSPCALPAPVTSSISDPNCSNCRRPFILLIHAGAFRVGCRSAMANECIRFAQRGYVAATIDYRLGWVPGDEVTTAGSCNNIPFCYPDTCSSLDGNTCLPIYADSNKFAVYRALQDAHAALRFIVHYANQLHIDTNSIYIGGQSAGAITAVNLAYVNQSELNLAYPSVVAALGRIDTAGNNLTDHFTISGVYNCWGAIVDTNFITGNKNKIPMVAFHGWKDSVVPYVKAPFLSCPYFDSSCGSYAIYQRLTRKYPNLPVELFSDKGGHGILQAGGGISLYRVQKAVCFFRNAKMGGTDTNLVQTTIADQNITLAQLQSLFPLNCGIVSATSRQLNPQTYDDEAHIVNGANNTIVCNYSLSGAKQVEISVFDMTGRKAGSMKMQQEAGNYTWHSSAINVPGIYIVTADFNGHRIATQKLFIGQ